MSTPLAWGLSRAQERQVGRLSGPGCREKVGARFVKHQEEPEAQQEGNRGKTPAWGRKVPVESRLCSALSHVHPLEQDAQNKWCLSFPICRMGPTSQPTSAGKLGRLQGVTGQTAPTLSRAGLPALLSWRPANLASHLLLAACAAQPSHHACRWSSHRTPSDDHLVHWRSSTPFLSALPGTRHGLMGKREVGP